LARKSSGESEGLREGALDFLAFSSPHPGSKTHVFALFWGNAKKKERLMKALPVIFLEGFIHALL
jgi:hypothetical protein